MKVTIGTAPCSWGVWWADGSPAGTPYEVFLDQAAEIGYQTLELGPVGYLPTDFDQLKEELDRRNLTICGGTACFDFIGATSFADVKEQVDDVCKRIKAFGSDELMVMDGTSLDRKKKAEMKDVYERTYKIFGETGKYCKDTYGVTCLMHPERCSIIETKEDFERLIDLDLYICYDNGHFGAANGGYEKGDTTTLDFFREYHDRIPYLHFKNYDGAIRKREMDGEIGFGDPAFDNMFVMLRDGVIDYEAYRDLLKELNFEGVAIIEQDCPHSTNEEIYALSKGNLEYLKEIGMI